MAKLSVFVVISSFIENGDEAKFGNGIDGIFETRKLAEKFCDLQGRRVHSDNGTLRWEKDEGGRRIVYDIVEFRFHADTEAVLLPKEKPSDDDLSRKMTNEARSSMFR